MRFNHDRDRHKANHMNAAVVAQDAQHMLHQLSMPVEVTDTIKARQQRAIRNSGLSPRKAIRIWYQHACTIAAHEYLQLAERYKNHVRAQEQRLAQELETLRSLIDEREMRERQHALALDAAPLEGAQGN